MVDWQTILFPDRPAAQFIICVIGGIFAVWLLILLNSFRKYSKYKRELNAYRQVDELRNEILHQRTTLGSSTDLSIGQPLSIMAAYFDSRSKEAGTAPSMADGPIQVHLWTIFLAGWQENRLDTAELLRVTNNRVFATSSLLRGVLSAFLVIGLLGTLIGLSDSLSQMSPSIKQAKSTIDSSKAAGEIIDSLKYAFAPSIWGVLATLVGLFVYLPFVHLVCQPLKHRLESMTIGVWLPQLMPTTSQNLLETLQKSEEQMHRNFEAAQTVAEFATHIKDEVQDFSPALKKANYSLKGITSAASEMNISVGHFGTYVARLEAFQTESSKVQQQIASNMESIRDSAHSASRLQESLQGVLSSASGAIEALAGRNQEVVEALGQPLRQELLLSLSEMKNTLQTGLGTLQNRFANMEGPLKHAADIMQGSLEHTTVRMEALLSALQREFTNQNQNNSEQIKNIHILAGKIAELLEGLKKFKTEEADIGRLSLSVEKLETSMKSLVEVLIKEKSSITDAAFQRTEKKKNEEAEVGRLSLSIERLESSMKSMFSSSIKDTASPANIVHQKNSWFSFVAVSVSLLLLIGLGYSQYRTHLLTNELMQHNKMILSEMQKLNSKIPVTPVSAVPTKINTPNASGSSQQDTSKTQTTPSNSTQSLSTPEKSVGQSTIPTLPNSNQKPDGAVVIPRGQ